MDIVEKVLRQELKAINDSLKNHRERRDKIIVEKDALTTQIDSLQADKATYINALRMLGYETT